jgi:murein DD-endopeptidase MepM/ murein hydrolase activator NlpD
MPFDPSATRSGTVLSTNPIYQAAWICYINGVEVPIMGFEIQFGVWKIPSFSIELIPDILLQRLGNEDRIPVQIFYLDYWFNPEAPEFRLLVDGEIIGWRYTSSLGNRTMSFSCLAHIHVFQQLYFFYMSNIDDVVASHDPAVQASGFTQTGGLHYPYSLFHQGLLVTDVQVSTAEPRPRRVGQTQTPAQQFDTSLDDRAQPPIQAPFELLYNVVKGVISKDVPANRRAIPMMNFFARHMRKTRFHNRFVRLPFLEDPDALADKKGVFPIFQAVRNDEAINAMQRQAATQIGNSGPVWNMLEQIFSMVYMEIAMIPNPAAVLVSLNSPTATTGGASGTPASGPQDGKILGVLSDRTPVTAIRTEAQLNPDQTLTNRATELATAIREALRFGRQPGTDLLASAGYSTAPASAADVNVDQIRTHLQQVAGTRADANGNTAEQQRQLSEGTDPTTPIRLAQYFVKPQFFFGIPPHCNVIFPSMVDGWTYDEPYLTPTRIYVNDSVMTSVLRASGSNREFMLHALTVAFPEEAEAVLEHKTGGTGGTSEAHNARPAMAESGKNLLIWPEEFYKGPITAKLALPSWFQMLRQFTNSNQNDTPPTTPTPSTAITVPAVANGDKAAFFMNGHVSRPGDGTAFSQIRGNSITSGSHFHAGADFCAPLGTTVHALFAGVVTIVKQNFQMQECGPTVVVRHRGKGPSGEDMWCTYMHLNEIDPAIRSGVHVTPGQVIGKVGNKNGNRVLQIGGSLHGVHVPSAVEQFGLEGVAAQAEACVSREACEELLRPYFANKTPPPEANRRLWPWQQYLEGPDGWKKVARAVGGFMRDDGPHCHFEIILDKPGITSPLRPPRLVNGVPDPNNRIDPVAYLAAMGISMGTNRSIPSSQMARRGTNNQMLSGAPPTSTGGSREDLPASLNLPEYEQPGAPAPTTQAPAAPAETALRSTTRPTVVALAGSAPAPTTAPQVTTHTAGSATTTTTPQNRPAGGTVHTPTGFNGTDRVVPPAAAPAQNASTTAPNATSAPNTSNQPLTEAESQQSQSFKELFKLYAQYEFLKQRYMSRQAGVQMRFNPYIVPGFPSMMFDSMRTRYHIAGYVQNVSHSASAAGGGSISTQVQLTCCRTLPEFINDVRSDSLRFTARVMAAPAEAIDSIRERIQDEDNAEAFYRRLFFGDGPRYNGVPAAFRWDDAMGYARGLEVDEIVNEGDSLAAAIAADNAAERAATAPTDGVVTTGSQAAAPPASAAPARQLNENLDPNRELSPRENIYQDAFDSYDVGMRLASRPACSLHDYIRFWHGGMTVNDLQNQGPNPPVKGPQEAFSYVSDKELDVVNTETAADGTRTNTRGFIARSSAVYYQRIFRLRGGPGTGADHLTPPSDAEQGFTAPTGGVETIQPTADHAGVARDYPQTRADWDSVLEQYTEKVRLLLRPSI